MSGEGDKLYVGVDDFVHWSIQDIDRNEFRPLAQATIDHFLEILLVTIR